MGRKKAKTSLEFVQKNPPTSVMTPILVGVVALMLMFACLIPPFLMGRLNDAGLLPSVARLVGSVVAGGFILFWNARVNKRDLRALGIRVSSWSGFMRGITYGLLLVFCCFAAIMSIDGFTFNFNASYDLLIAIYLLAATLIEASVDEILFRGYLQTGVASKSSFLVALLLQAVLFTVAHAITSSISFSAICSVFLMGILYGLVFWLTDNLLMTIAMHFMWNFVTGPILGISVSGTLLPTTLLTATPTSSELISGGSFGIEASLVTIFVWLVACAIVGWKYYRAQGEKK